jgi:3-isopropylmalate/(R)-2-methylmalate dehydratase small subunit
LADGVGRDGLLREPDVEAFTTHSGRVLPLRRSNVDTDQIIPAEYLKRVTRTGYADGLFAAWRNDESFVLNRPEHDGASILVAGPDFGTGSSREHAVWALQDYGFRVVVGTRFGDIFRSNASKAGLLVAVVGDDVVEQLWSAVDDDPRVSVTVDLEKKIIEWFGRQVTFEIDDYTRWRLLNGLDDIAVTLTHEAEISTYEGKSRPFRPTTL